MSDEGHFKCRTVLAMATADIGRLTKELEEAQALVHHVYREMLECLSEAEDSSSYYGGGGDATVAAKLTEIEARIAGVPDRQGS